MGRLFDRLKALRNAPMHGRMLPRLDKFYIFRCREIIPEPCWALKANLRWVERHLSIRIDNDTPLLMVTACVRHVCEVPLSFVIVEVDRWVSIRARCI